MAAVDKIYVSKRQFEILEEWYNMMVDEKLMPKYIPFNQYNINYDLWEEHEEDKPVWNLDVKEYMWLLSNCPFDFVTDEIKLNYDLEDD